MDEKALRAHFERIARRSLPPSTVDLARARKAGLRRLRIRRAGVPAASFAVAIAVGALFASGVLPTGGTGRPEVTTHGHKGQVRKTGHASGPMAPASFDPLAIYATFGWLPRGFFLTNPPSPQTPTESFAYVDAPSGRSGIALTVYAAHQCSVSGPFWSPPRGTFQFTDGGKHNRYLHSQRYSHGLTCGVEPAPNPILPAGHLTNGHPAYLMLNLDDHPTALAWQYARYGWAIAQWSNQKPAQLREIASHVRYRSNLHLRFPFRLTGIPASWKVTGAGSQVEGGKLRGYLLNIDPGQDSKRITILVQFPYLSGCEGIGGTTKSATFDGATGVTRSYGQEACFGDLHGMFVSVHSHEAGGALGLLHHLQVLGPDPANWTTQPLG